MFIIYIYPQRYNKKQYKQRKKSRNFKFLQKKLFRWLQTHYN